MRWRAELPRIPKKWMLFLPMSAIGRATSLSRQVAPNPLNGVLKFGRQDDLDAPTYRLVAVWPPSRRMIGFRWARNGVFGICRRPDFAYLE